MSDVLLMYDPYTKKPEVENLQKRLNCEKITRLPRLNADQRFGVLPKPPAMECQFQKGLKVDGKAGSQTFKALGSADCETQAPPKGMCILVDLINNRLYAFTDGKQDHLISPIHGGSHDDPSTQGVFKVDPKRR